MLVGISNKQGHKPDLIYKFIMFYIKIKGFIRKNILYTLILESQNSINYWNAGGCFGLFE